MHTQITGLYTGAAKPMPGDGRSTAIFKQPVHARVHLGPEGLDGDVQADRRVHGGPEKALHHFPADNYARLARAVPDLADSFVPGAIGENISTQGYTETEVCIGDIYACGSARIQLCQPRTPCWKIDARFDVEGLAKAIQVAGMSGWYYRVLEEGEIAAGDEWSLLERNPEPFSLSHFWHLAHTQRPDLDELMRLATTPGLAPQWQQRIRDRHAWLLENGDRAELGAATA